ALWGAVLLLAAAFAEILRRARQDSGAGAARAERAARVAPAERAAHER
ncbi:DUF1275 domain-containing protein, partial [Burkholderia pseudomallei]